MKPDRMRSGGWIAEKWRYRAAQRTRARVRQTEIVAVRRDDVADDNALWFPPQVVKEGER